MDNIPGWKVFSAGIGVAALVVVGFFVYQWFFATPTDLKQLEEEAVAHAIEKVVEEVYQQKILTDGEQRLIVMPVRGDTSNEQVREMLLDRLNAVEGIRADKPSSPSLEERAIGIFNKVAKDEESERDPAEVFEDAGEVDEVLSVSVAKKWAGADSGVCKLDVTRIVKEDETDERKAAVLDPQRFEGFSGTAREDEVEPDETGPGFWSSVGGFLWRALVVLAAMAILPFLSWPAARFAFKQDSNAMNAGLLFGLTALDLLVLLLLVAFQVSTTVVISAGLLLPVALVWNLKILNYIEEQ